MSSPLDDLEFVRELKPWQRALLERIMEMPEGAHLTILVPPQRGHATIRAVGGPTAHVFLPHGRLETGIREAEPGTVEVNNVVVDGDGITIEGTITDPALIEAIKGSEPLRGLSIDLPDDTFIPDGATSTFSDDFRLPGVEIHANGIRRHYCQDVDF